MYAILKTGGKQYKVSPGETIKVDKIEGGVGDEVTFCDILMVVDDKNQTAVGRPVLADAKISGRIKRQTKGDKIIVFKFKRRKGYRKKTGHRQLLTEVMINEILLSNTGN